MGAKRAVRAHGWLPASAAAEKIVGNTLWLFLDRIARMAVGLVVGAWVTRHLGPERFGQLSYAGAFVSILTAVAGVGLDGIVVRDIVREPRRSGEILGTAFGLKVGGGALAVGLALAGLGLLQPVDTVLVQLVVLLSFGPILQSLDVIDFWFQSRVESKYVAICRSAAFGVASSLRVLLILANAPLRFFAGVVLLESLVAAAGLLLAYQRTVSDLRRWRWEVSTARRLLRDSWPLIFSSLMIALYMRVDQVMLGRLAGAEEVGVYSAAVSLVEAWYFVPLAVASSTLPSIVEARALGEETFLRRLQHLYNWMALLGYAVALPATVLSNWIVHVLYGVRYERAVPILAIFSWSIVFTNLGVARSSFLTAMNWTKTHFFTVSLGCIVNLVLNFWWIPKWGGVGAAGASLVAYWVAAHGSCFLYPPLRRTGVMLTRSLVWPRVW